MKRVRLAFTAALAALALVAPAQSQTIAGFADLNYWGSGPNRSALVISWNDGKDVETLAWGFSWSGSATVTDMLQALAAADPRFFIRIDSASANGLGLFGIGYDSNGNGVFSVTGAVDESNAPVTPVFTAGISDLNTNAATFEDPFSSEDAAPADLDDHYVEGWNDNGFWEFFTGGSSALYPGSWTSPLDAGASVTTLANDGWYAFSITDVDFTSNPPGPAIAAVPEPATVALFILGGIALLGRRRLRRA